MLYIVGAGLRPRDLSIRAQEVLKNCEKVFLEGYTSIFSEGSVSDIERLAGRKIILLSREEFENERVFLKDAGEEDVCVLVVGDPLVATTHVELLLELEERGIRYEVVHGVSVISAISELGLFIYKFGRSVSVPLWVKDFEPESFYDYFKTNFVNGMHTLFFLDLKPGKGEFLSIPKAVSMLRSISDERHDGIITPETCLVGVARLGASDQKIICGTLEKLEKEDFGPPPYLLVVASELHFVEEEALKRFGR